MRLQREPGVPPAGQGRDSLTELRWPVTGTVKKFIGERGFGFITPDEGGSEVFVHQSGIIMEGVRTLEEGQRVEFEVEEGPKGLRAIQVKLI